MNRTIKSIIGSVLPLPYIEVTFGDINLVLSAPHGGMAKPLSIPRRKYGKTAMDTYTRRITNTLRDSYTGDRPSTVVANIHRSRVDFNRTMEEATQGSKRAINLWLDWNYNLRHIFNGLLRTHKKILYVDIHSHNDSDEFELGYNLNSPHYLELENTGTTKKHTSIDSLSHNKYDMIFGEYSMKNSLELYGYKVLRPDEDNVYFNGGRNIEVFSGEGVGAIQIEVPVSVVKKDFNFTIYALKFAIETFRKHFTL